MPNLGMITMCVQGLGSGLGSLQPTIVALVERAYDLQLWNWWSLRPTTGGAYDLQ